MKGSTFIGRYERSRLLTQTISRPAGGCQPRKQKCRRGGRRHLAAGAGGWGLVRAAQVGQVLGADDPDLTGLAGRVRGVTQAIRLVVGPAALRAGGAVGAGVEAV